MSRSLAPLALVALGAWGCAASTPPPPPTPPAAAAPIAADTALAARWTPALDAPRADASRRVAWARSPLPVRPGVAAVRARLAAGDTAGARAAALATPGLEAWGLRQSARAWMAAGDTARGDSAWARLAALDSPWAWEAWRERADLAIADAREARADSLLATADRTGWPDLERAAWLSRRARLRAAFGDTAQAMEFCRQLIRRYPSTTPAAGAVTQLEAMLVARGERPSVDDAVDAAEVFALRGERSVAVRRLEAALARAPAERRWRIGLRAGELLRQERRWDAARPALEAARRAAPSDDDRGRVTLELARVERDRGQAASGLREFARARALIRTPATAAVAAWEHALELDGGGRGAAARAAYRAVTRVGGTRAREAALRVALSWLAEGRRDSALALLRDATDDAGRFWRAALRPPSERAIAEAEWRAVASRPGYGFYAVAARESLGVVGWDGSVAGEGCADAGACAPLERAWDLVAVGAADEALTIVGRWAATAATDARLSASAPGSPAESDAAPDAGSGDDQASPPVPTERAGEEGTPGTSAGSGPGAASPPSAAAPPAPSARGLALRRASRIAYTAGRVPFAIRMAQRAIDAAPAEAPVGETWGAVTWLYPPAFDSLYRAMPDSMWTPALTPALARAIAWQESRFDPRARSRSNALGLYQIKLPTAGDVARWRGDPPPTEERLFDPDRSIRYGVAYLAWLLRRFDGHPLVAVAAYNSGPSAVSASWRSDLSRGGVALFCERIGRAETRDYVRRVMAARAAYRELSPYAE